jgi:hypothetical protein
MTVRSRPDYLRLVESRRAPRIEVRISVAKASEPIGRFRLFNLHPRDLAEQAVRLEAGGSRVSTPPEIRPAVGTRCAG